MRGKGRGEREGKGCAGGYGRKVGIGVEGIDREEAVRFG